MKRAAFCLLLAGCTGLGCESLPTLWPSKPPPKPAVAAQPAKPRPVVTPEEVTDGNAHQAAAALLDEMDRDAQGEVPPADEKKLAAAKGK